MLGWIFGGLVKKFERATKSITHNFGKEIDRLFDEQLNPLVNNIDHIAQARIKQVKKDIIKQAKTEVEELETKTKADIEDLLNNADTKVRGVIEELNRIRLETIKDTENLVDKTDAYLENRINQVSLLVMQALNGTFKEINALEDKLFQDANDLIDRLDDTGEGIIEKIFYELKKRLDYALPSPFDECRQKLNIRWKSGAKLSDVELYELIQCKELSKLNESTPIDQVLKIYGQLELNAARMAALSRKTKGLRIMAVQDWIKYGVLWEFWYNTVKTYNSSDSVLLNVHKPVGLLTENNDYLNE